MRVPFALLIFSTSVTATSTSVCRDATYDVPEGRGITCSGPASEAAAGVACPWKGDVAIENCNKHLDTWDNGNCVATEDAVCAQLGSGAWGCVFPSIGCDGVNPEAVGLATCGRPLNYDGCANDEIPCGEFAGFPLVCVTDQGNSNGQCLCSSDDEDCLRAVSHHDISKEPGFLPQFGKNCETSGCYGSGQLCNQQECPECAEPVECATHEDGFTMCHTCSSCLENPGFDCTIICGEERFLSDTSAAKEDDQGQITSEEADGTTMEQGNTANSEPVVGSEQDGNGQQPANQSTTGNEDEAQGNPEESTQQEETEQQIPNENSPEDTSNKKELEIIPEISETCARPLYYVGCALDAVPCGDFAGFQLVCKNDNTTPYGQCLCDEDDTKCQQAITSHDTAAIEPFLPQFGINCDDEHQCHGSGQRCNAADGDCLHCVQTVGCVTNEHGFSMCHTCASCLASSESFSCSTLCDERRFLRH